MPHDSHSGSPCTHLLPSTFFTLLCDKIALCNKFINVLNTLVPHNESGPLHPSILLDLPSLLTAKSPVGKLPLFLVFDLPSGSARPRLGHCRAS